MWRRAVPYLRTPQLFLIFTICAALAAPFSETVSVVIATAGVLICFKPKISLPLITVYLLSIYAAAHSAFILETEYSTKHRTYLTTKGYMQDIECDCKIGDLVVGNFDHSIVFNGILPRRYAKPVGAFTAYRVPVISAMLDKRERHAAYLFNVSGGVITTTQTHTMAVRKYIPAELNDQYTITGLAHLLSMSGSHVVIFIAGIFLMFSFLHKKLRAIPVLIFLPVLIPLSGFTITVVRAVIFGMAAMIAWLLDLKLLSLRFLALVAAFTLLFSPYSLYSISFLMSFFAVFGIVIIIKSHYNAIIKVVMIGLASTVFTLPLQLWIFGTSNIFSVVTTVIFTPVVSLQMLLGTLSFVAPDITIAPMMLVERFAAWFMGHIYHVSWYFLYVAKPPTWILAVSFAVAFGLCFTRFRLAAMLVLLVPLLPVYEKNILNFPSLHPSQKGYILVSDKGSEIFFQGRRATFVRVMVPEAGKLGIKTFDYGKIRIFDGDNLYLKIRQPEKFSGIVCVNSDDGCPYVYITRSSTLSPPLNPAVKKYIIYNNKFVDDRIILLKKTESYSTKLNE